MTELCRLAVSTSAGVVPSVNIGPVSAQAAPAGPRIGSPPATAAAAREQSSPPADSIAAHIRFSAAPIDWDRAFSGRRGRTRNQAVRETREAQDQADTQGFLAFPRGSARARPAPSPASNWVHRPTAKAAATRTPNAARCVRNLVPSPGRASSLAPGFAGCSHGAWAADQALGIWSEKMNRTLKIKVNGDLITAAPVISICTST